MNNTILKRLNCFAIVILLLSALLVNAKPAKSGLQLSPQVTLNVYQALVENHLQGVLQTLKTIATTSEAKSQYWELIKPILDQYGAELKTEATIWYALPNGEYYSTETGGLVHQNLKDRAYFAKLLEGNDILGELVISKSTNLRSVIVATPVKQNDKVVAALGVSVSVERLSQFVEKALELPSNTYFYALNSDAKIALHKNAERMFKNVADVGDESLGEAFKKEFEKGYGQFSYKLKEQRINSVFKKSSVLNLYFFIAQIQNRQK